MVEDAYNAWAGDIDDGIDAVLIATDAHTVDALNARAHHDRVAGGQVAPTASPAGRGRSSLWRSDRHPP